MANKPERNDPCHCGSGKKYKNCCRQKDKKQVPSKMGIAGIVVAVILGLFIVGLALSGGGSSQDCPPGTVWSDTHQHCH
jgi:hypothetical protein